MARANLPDDIIRLLSFHGPVELWTGKGEKASTAKVHMAPFDDELIMLVPNHSLLVEGLLQTCKATVTAKADDQSYTVRLEGHATAGRVVSVHQNRNAITPWLPEGEQPHRYLAVPFVAENVEMVRDEGQVRNRYAGPTPAGRDRPNAVRRWLSAALGGEGRLLTPLALLSTFLWYGYLGADYPWRPVGVVFAWLACLGLISGIRLIGQSAVFHKWRRGDAKVDDAPALRDGHISPDEARMGGIVALLLATIAVFVVAFMPRGGASVMIILVGTGSPVLAAYWVLHNSVRSRDVAEN